MTILALWRGDLPLADAFWTWTVFGGLIVNIATSIGFFRPHNHRPSLGGYSRGVRAFPPLQRRGGGRRLEVGGSTQRVQASCGTCAQR